MNLDKEVAALEHLIDTDTKRYYSTPSLLGKKWYGIGLEDNEANDQKDNTNKKGIIKRMIDAVSEFIRKVIARIADFLKGKGSKENEEIKNYKGPTEEALSKEQSRADWAKNIASKLSIAKLTVLCTMVESEFFKDYEFIMDESYRHMTSADVSYDGMQRSEPDLKRCDTMVKECRRLIKSEEGMGKERCVTKLAAILEDNSKIQSLLITNYFGGNLMLKHAEKYLDAIVAQLVKLHAHASSTEEVKLLQQSAMTVSAIVVLILNVSQAYDTLVTAITSR